MDSDIENALVLDELTDSAVAVARVAHARLAAAPKRIATRRGQRFSAEEIKTRLVA